MIAVGAVIMVAGLALLRAGAAPGAGVGWLVPGLLVDGLGMGMVLAPLAVTVLTRVTPQHAGPAAGMLSTVQQVGNALVWPCSGSCSMGRSAAACRTRSAAA